MKLLSHLSLAIVLLGTTPALYPQSSDSLQTLRPAHPRLILLDDELPRIHEQIDKDPFSASIYAQLIRTGDGMLATPVHPYLMHGEGPDRHLLATADQVEQYVLTLSGLYRLTGQKKYADRAIAEMLSAAAYPDWNPVHFLDTAELSASLAIGYDWLYPILTPAQRTTIRTALITKAIDPFLDPANRVRNPNDLPERFTFHNNWAQVCYGGETLAALALAEEEPARARTILARTHTGMQQIMRLFAPDGGFEEGPGYWSYATAFNVLYLAGLDSALGSDGGLAEMPGFSGTGEYRVQLVSPIMQTANFGDAHETLYRAPQMFWMAHRFNKPEYAEVERHVEEATLQLKGEGRSQAENDRFLILALIYYHPSAPTHTEPATVQSFQRTAQTFLRGDWLLPDGSFDPNTPYLAFKGGSATESHGHLDLGSFILDNLGERWAIDLGSETYAVPGYFNFSKLRWTYFRTRNESHNTLTIDGAIQDLDADATVSAIGHSAKGEQKFAVLNLNSVFKSQLKSWSRGVALLDHHRILIQDELVPKHSADVLWTFMTQAQVSGGHNLHEAVLALHGKRLLLRILSPANAEFQQRAIPPLSAPQRPVRNTSDLIVHLSGVNAQTRIAVLVTTPDDSTPEPSLSPLSAWADSFR